MIRKKKFGAATFLVLAANYCKSAHIFIIGDSIDRYIVEDFCLNRGDAQNCGGSACSYWASNAGIPLTYKIKGYPTHVRCDMGDDSITTLHNYGTNDEGPYFSLSSAHNDTYAATPLRIAHALELYFDRIGVPDMVIYHGTQWDIQGLYEQGGMLKSKWKWDYEDSSTSAWQTAIVGYESSLNKRLNDVFEGVTKNLNRLQQQNGVVNIGLRTAVWNSGGGPLLHAFNMVTRKVAKERNVSLFDLDNDVWGAVNWNFTLERKVLRDFIHPSR